MGSRQYIVTSSAPTYRTDPGDVACCTKDTYVSLALQTVRDPRWVEKQTGVALATLRTHYKKWMPDPARDELRRLERAFGSGGSAGNGPDLDPSESALWTPARKFRCEIHCEEGDLNPSVATSRLKKSRS